MPKIIFICHPWRGNLKPGENNPYPDLTEEVCRHIALNSDDIPLATGLYINQFLRDHIDKERMLGIKIGQELMKKCDIIYSYEMNGKSVGMEMDLTKAKELKIPIIKFMKYPWQT